MTFIQHFFSALLPRAWADDMQAVSRSWMMRCTCGFERSIWDTGGIRWKAKGNSRWLIRCPRCGQLTWHRVYRPAAGDERPST